MLLWAGGHSPADLGDQWQSSSNVAQNEAFPGYGNRAVWNGVLLESAFWLPNAGAIIIPQNVPDILDSHRNDLVADVDVRVQDVPREMRNWDAHSILSDYNAPIFAGSRLNLKGIQLC